MSLMSAAQASPEAAGREFPVPVPVPTPRTARAGSRRGGELPAGASGRRDDGRWDGSRRDRGRPEGSRQDHSAAPGRPALRVTEVYFRELQIRELQVRQVRVGPDARRPGTTPAGRPAFRATAARPGVTAERPAAAAERPGAAVEHRRATADRSRVAAAGPAPLRLTRRGRTVVTVLALLAACAVAMVLWLSEAGGAQASSHGQPAGAGYQGMTRVVVEPGQTLWSIASAAEPTANTQSVIQQIIDANALGRATIYAGQLLWVPRA